MRRTTVYVVGYPKSGSTWLSRLLGDALDSPVGAVFPPSSGKAIATEGQKRQGAYYIRQGHPTLVKGKFDGRVVPGIHKFAYENLSGEPIILITRDPRDIIVSGAFHWGRDKVMAEYLLCVANGKWPMTHGGGLVPFVTSWLASGLVKAWTSYEKLRSDTLSELDRILKQIDISPVKPLAKVVNRQSFEARKAWTRSYGERLNYGRDFQLRFLRKGIVGDWHNHFDHQKRVMAEEHFGALMRRLGYTDGPEWVNF